MLSILTTPCPDCKKAIRIKSWASTRPDLDKQKGKEFDVNCSNCGSTNKIHVNDVKA